MSTHSEASGLRAGVFLFDWVARPSVAYVLPGQITHILAPPKSLKRLVSVTWYTQEVGDRCTAGPYLATKSEIIQFAKQRPATGGSRIP